MKITVLMVIDLIIFEAMPLNHFGWNYLVGYSFDSVANFI